MTSQLPLKFLVYVISYVVAIWPLAKTSDFSLFFSTAMSLVAIPFLIHWNAQSKKSALLLEGIPLGLSAIPYFYELVSSAIRPIIQALSADSNLGTIAASIEQLGVD